MRAARAVLVHMPAGSIRLLSRVAEHQLAPDEHAHDAAPRARASHPQTRRSALRRLPRRGARPPCSWVWHRHYCRAARWRRERQSAPQPPGHLSCRRTPPGRRAAGCCWSIRAAGAGVGGGWFLRHRPWRRQQTLPAAAAAAMASVPTRRGRGPSRPAWCTLELGAGRRSPPPRATAKRCCSDPAVRRWPRHRAASARAAPAPSRQLPLPPTSDCSDEGRETCIPTPFMVADTYSGN